jgi:hypothetical protein
VRPSPALVRRIDRLAKRAHAFHRFAHHPLCDNYAGELIALRGRSRVCRGCASALGSGLLGVSVALVARLPVLPLVGACVVVSCALLIAQSRPAQPGSTRPAKLWTRGAPAFLLAASVVTCLRTPSLGYWSAAAGLLLLGRMVLARYRMRGPDRSPCSVCPERQQAAPCSGFRSIVRAERAFVRRSERLIFAAVAGASSEAAQLAAAMSDECSPAGSALRLGFASASAASGVQRAAAPCAEATSPAGPFAT